MLVAAVAVVAMASAAGGAVWAANQKHVNPHGVDIGIHPITDTNFCLETEGDGRIMVSECATRDNQHFMFTNNADGSVTIVDGYGLCLDRGDGKPGSAVTSGPCNFGPRQRFNYSTTGKLQQPGGTSCVAVSVAAQGAPAFDDSCGTAKYVKIFQLSR